MSGPNEPGKPPIDVDDAGDGRAGDGAPLLPVPPAIDASPQAFATRAADDGLADRIAAMIAKINSSIARQESEMARQQQCIDANQAAGHAAGPSGDHECLYHCPQHADAETTG